MVRRAYGVLIDNAKKEHWEGFLALLDERSVWMAHRYASGELMDGGQARIPLLKGGQTAMRESHRLWLRQTKTRAGFCMPHSFLNLKGTTLVMHMLSIQLPSSSFA